MDSLTRPKVTSQYTTPDYDTIVNDGVFDFTNYEKHVKAKSQVPWSHDKDEVLLDRQKSRQLLGENLHGQEWPGPRPKERSAGFSPEFQ